MNDKIYSKICKQKAVMRKRMPFNKIDLISFCYFKHDIFFKKITAWKLSKYGVFSGLYFSVFRLNSGIYSVNLPIQSKPRKIRTRKNSLFWTLLMQWILLDTSKSTDYSDKEEHHSSKIHLLNETPCLEKGYNIWYSAATVVT